MGNILFQINGKSRERNFARKQSLEIKLQHVNGQAVGSFSQRRLPNCRRRDQNQRDDTRIAQITQLSKPETSTEERMDSPTCARSALYLPISASLYFPRATSSSRD